jgi:succinate dehydrogenase/fumarate reductase-like Fe-S protein
MRAVGGPQGTSEARDQLSTVGRKGLFTLNRTCTWGRDCRHAVGTSSAKFAGASPPLGCSQTAVDQKAVDGWVIRVNPRLG